jgi:hypothetical protein
LIASSVVEMIVGKIIAARVKPPERIDHPILRVMTKKTNPKSPKIMDGIPARQSVPNRMRRLIRLSRVYSLKKIAVPTPNGVAKMIATTVNATVPMMVEKIPPSRPMLLGESRKNRRWRTGSPSFKIWKRIRIITPMVERAATQMRVFAILWVMNRVRRCIIRFSFAKEKWPGS